MDCVTSITRSSSHHQVQLPLQVQLPSPSAAPLPGTAPIAGTTLPFVPQLRERAKHLLLGHLHLCSTPSYMQAFSPNVMFKHFKPASGKGSVPTFPYRTYRSRRDTALLEAGLCGNSWPCTPSTLF